ncbi:diheme cytochrome c [Candidatus Thiothrix anitrata]|uniref:Diheme cytochrome c n=1 Tax=Candidatus Thiothrix anitrata TaxID=2823902 RepID=A0ABX7X3E2_9GAMM|nr:diheme cytochrome c [Candidatus Thiothrix anitrata]QTR49303.1 diheme cytochrome c [Candidatus Thiothrix anitrata]
MLKKTRVSSLMMGVLLITSTTVFWVSKQVVADDDGEKHGSEHVYSATLPVWKTECGECHIAYPPQLLPAASWQKMMGSLDNHFGTDASLDADAIAEILPFLEKNAGSERKYAAAPSKSAMRITETRWFIKEHDEVSASTWKRIDSPANCAACHTTAEQGNYDEDFIKIPR